ncbi:MAG: hypothetical protein D9N11_14020 [Ketobacter sp.]|nr:MAG: hypothetical protein D9N11_14020 [Ketobacter sp.]
MLLQAVSMRIITTLLLILWSTVSLAQDSYTVLSRTSISSDNWYPLSEQNMKAAAVDAALSELTRHGRFLIVRDINANTDKLDGDLGFHISLIGPAEVVKLTAELQLNHRATYVSSVSMDIHGMDYQGIYNAFEFVGIETAKRLNAKMTLPESDDTPTQASSSDRRPNNLVSAQYNQAQTLKREGHYHEARALFEQIAKQSPETKWNTMARDELRYGLPIFEADSILPNNALQDPTLLLDKMIKVTHLYRQILADNTDNPQRVMDVNHRLDQMTLSIKHMHNAVKASAISRATPLRIMLMEHLMETGEWPEPNRLKQLLTQLSGDFNIVSYERQQNQADLVIEEPLSGVILQFGGDMRGVSITTR